MYLYLYVRSIINNSSINEHVIMMRSPFILFLMSITLYQNAIKVSKK